jgi:hypothetical protein
MRGRWQVRDWDLYAFWAFAVILGAFVMTVVVGCLVNPAAARADEVPAPRRWELVDAEPLPEPRVERVAACPCGSACPCSGAATCGCGMQTGRAPALPPVRLPFPPAAVAVQAAPITAPVPAFSPAAFAPLASFVAPAAVCGPGGCGPMGCGPMANSGFGGFGAPMMGPPGGFGGFGGFGGGMPMGGFGGGGFGVGGCPGGRCR